MLLKRFRFETIQTSRKKYWSAPGGNRGYQRSKVDA